MTEPAMSTLENEAEGLPPNAAPQPLHAAEADEADHPHRQISDERSLGAFRKVPRTGVIYVMGEATRLGPARLDAARITFKQIPYDVGRG